MSVILISFSMSVGFNPHGQSLTVGLMSHQARQRYQVNIQVTFERVLRIVPLSVILLVLQGCSHADAPFQLVFGVFVSLSESSGQKKEPLEKSRSVHNSHLPTGHTSRPTNIQYIDTCRWIMGQTDKNAPKHVKVKKPSLPYVY